ncbi:MerR family transcriptional regulator [Actinomycetospora sp. TBRC 11914]|uniref:helix-turn-helix domain-containing protein n=1 Tax=Actinomycetospora sp. TBRC 11914 TaxID=2729387 RepID=UPI00145F7C57|nr:MerR family transcriptional regulator [Actinomycetospora sp. TBRC 11914]NMO92365.1 MerR family transcriptional regulator [Actinomycetospora sp. TBRC 11914]
MGAENLEDEDVPALTTGQAAGVIGVQPAFLRSLDAGQMLRPVRSAGGHRRWTRRQLALAARVRALFDEGFTLTAAWKVVSLEDRVDEVTHERDLARAELERTRRELARVRRDSAEEVARAEPTARTGSSGGVHRAPGLRDATGPAPATA